MPDPIETIEEGAATLTFNRPERMNTLPTPIMEGLLSGLRRLAGASAKLVTAFVKVGHSGDVGRSFFLTKLVDTATAREFYFTGRPVDAQKRCPSASSTASYPSINPATL